MFWCGNGSIKAYLIKRRRKHLLSEMIVEIVLVTISKHNFLLLATIFSL